HRGGCHRLRPAGGGEIGWRHRRVPGALRAVRGDEEGDLAAPLCPFRQRASGPELGVVGVGGDRQGSPGYLECGGGTGCFGEEVGGAASHGGRAYPASQAPSTLARAAARSSGVSRSSNRPRATTTVGSQRASPRRWR